MRSLAGRWTGMALGLLSSFSALVFMTTLGFKGTVSVSTVALIPLKNCHDLKAEKLDGLPAGADAI